MVLKKLPRLHAGIGTAGGLAQWTRKLAFLNRTTQLMNIFFLSWPFDGERSPSITSVLRLQPLPALEGLDWGTWVKDLAVQFHM